MTTEHVRDLAATAVIFGFFASSWFGWAQEAPPRRWRGLLAAGSVTSLLTAVVGGLLTWRHWHDGTAFDEDTSRAFGVVVGIEFGAAALGSLLLAIRSRRELIPVWIAFVVGVHLFPVAALIGYPLIHVLAALITVVSLAAIPIARARKLTMSAVVGAPTGLVLLAAALFSVIAAAVTRS
ncbi:hypothetical protein [Micromonospora endophytica]|uniref:Uncharacterized protein n=1 Tax=Micromonospora endophytica TaxID=515350 RepID=A0A2W2DUC5_9ACTN|nr:hypothetical protein [Micromonospora endophytica]PZG00747.1 hypothetical protein C1I93_01795 [Micromonospora endophytica]RIW44868.1 hypothetical protein D3H59_16940 [Micromonospora endophytica]BCJ57603.1 hypothetical protein Jiend_10250 [Micromonospora endophytica]